MLRDRIVRGRRSGARTIAFNAEEKIGRDENRLQANGEPLGQRTFLLLHLLNEAHVRDEFSSGDRPAECPPCEIGDNLARAHRRVRAGQVPAGIDLLQAGASRPGRLRIGAANVQRVDAHAVHRDLGELRLRILERLLQLSESLGRRVWRRLEFSRRTERAVPTDSDRCISAAAPRRFSESPPRCGGRQRVKRALNSTICPPKSCRSSLKVAERSGSNGIVCTS